MTTNVILAGETTYVVIPDDTLGTLVHTPTGDEAAYVIADDALTTVFVGSEGPAGLAGANARSDIAFGWQGRLIDGEELPGVVLAYPITVTSAGSFAWARVAATSQLILSIAKNTSSTIIGTVTFEAGAHQGTVILSGGTFNGVRGDFIYLIVPVPSDATLSDGSVTLAST